MGSRRRKPSLLVTLAAVTMAVTACSLVVDTSGLAGSDAVDASEVSAPDVSDASTAPDRQPDGPAARHCDATFCDDFDEGGATGRWSSEEIASSGSIVLDDGDTTTKPNALHVTYASPSNADYLYAVLRKDFAVAQRIACEIDIKLLKRPTEDFVDLLRFETSGGSLDKQWLWFGVDSTSGAGEFREDRFYKDGSCECPVRWVTPPSLVVGKWTHVKFETDFKRARVSYDGKMVIDEPVVTFTASKPLTLSLGASGHSTSQVEVLYDGLACTVGP